MIASFPLLLITAILLIFIYYYINIGHFPDLFSFIEYAVSWTGGFFSSEFNFTGTLWMPIIILSWIMLEFFYSENIKEKFLLLSFWSGLWALCSYSIGQSEDVTMFRHGYLYFFFFFLVLKLTGFKKYKIFLLLPVFFSLISFTFSSLYFFVHFHKTITNQNYNLKDTEHEIIDDYNQLLSLIEHNEIPLVYIEPGRYRFFNSKKIYIDKKTEKIINLNDRIWLPLNPAILMDPLMHERRKIYMKRWISRHNYSKGWIVNPISDHWHSDLYKLIDESLEDYNKTKEFNYGKLKAILYEQKL